MSANALNLSCSPATSFNQYIDQGTWTPVIAGSTVAGAGTYTLQVGYYTRIGNLVFLGGTVAWTAHTGTGNMLIQGLPFTSRNSANYHYDVNVNLIGIVLPAGTVQVMGEIGPNVTRIILEGTRNNNTNLPVAMDAAGQADISGFYLV